MGRGEGLFERLHFSFEVGDLVKKFSFRGCTPWGIPLGRRYRRTRRVAASRGGCPSTADDKGKEGTYSLSTLNI